VAGEKQVVGGMSDGCWESVAKLQADLCTTHCGI